MIKTVFVPTSGSDTDARVFATALALARPLGAHLRFFHLRLSACEAAVRFRHVEFCAESAVNDALRRLEERDADLSATAARHVNDFCAANDIPLRTTTGKSFGLSAQFLEETDDAEARFIAHSRHSDLIVMGRPLHQDLMPFNLIEKLLLGSGRPIVIADDSPHIGAAPDTIVIAWKDTPQTARAVGAAMPLLEMADKVAIVHVAEPDSPVTNGLDLLAEELSWHGISTEVRVSRNPLAHAPGILQSIASEFNADLLVVGAYGRGPWREAVFGGVTTALIDHAECPVFMMH
jgi:nucleotide-binding universal stress UspA family protein